MHVGSLIAIFITLLYDHASFKQFVLCFYPNNTGASSPVMLL